MENLYIETLEALAKNGKTENDVIRRSDDMASLQEQLIYLRTKDDMIKWLLNEYYLNTRKIYGSYMAESETGHVKAKADELMNGNEEMKDVTIDINLSLRDLETLTREDVRKTLQAKL